MFGFVIHGTYHLSSTLLLWLTIPPHSFFLYYNGIVHGIPPFVNILWLAIDLPEHHGHSSASSIAIDTVEIVCFKNFLFSTAFNFTHVHGHTTKYWFI